MRCGDSVCPEITHRSLPNLSHLCYVVWNAEYTAPWQRRPGHRSGCLHIDNSRSDPQRHLLKQEKGILLTSYMEMAQVWWKDSLSPVQKQKLLLVSVPSQAAADLQSIVVGWVGSGRAQALKLSRANTDNGSFGQEFLFFSKKKNLSPVHLLQEKFNRSSAHIHHLQDHYYIVSGHNLQKTKELSLSSK